MQINTFLLKTFQDLWSQLKGGQIYWTVEDRTGRWNVETNFLKRTRPTQCELPESAERGEEKLEAMETRGGRLRCGRQCESNLSVINAESNQASNTPVISPKTRTMLQAVFHQFTNRTTSQFIGLQISQLHYLYKPPLLNLLPTVVKKPSHNC